MPDGRSLSVCLRNNAGEITEYDGLPEEIRFFRGVVRLEKAATETGESVVRVELPHPCTASFYQRDRFVGMVVTQQLKIANGAVTVALDEGELVLQNGIPVPIEALEHPIIPRGERIVTIMLFDERGRRIDGANEVPYTAQTAGGEIDVRTAEATTPTSALHVRLPKPATVELSASKGIIGSAITQGPSIYQGRLIVVMESGQLHVITKVEPY